MKIEFTYKLIENEVVHNLSMSPEEYFENKIDEYDVDDIPKFNFIEEYLSNKVDEIDFVKLEVLKNKSKLIIEANFWNSGKNSSLKYLLHNDDENYIYEFLKINKKFEKDNMNYDECISFYRNEINLLELKSHVIINDEGSIVEVIKKSDVKKHEQLGKQIVKK